VSLSFLWKSGRLLLGTLLCLFDWLSWAPVQFVKYRSQNSEILLLVISRHYKNTGYNYTYDS